MSRYESYNSAKVTTVGELKAWLANVDDDTKLMQEGDIDHSNMNLQMLEPHDTDMPHVATFSLTRL